MPGIQETIARVREIRARERDKLQPAGPLAPSREEALGLVYKKGDNVYDERTGKEYRVIAGTRKSFTVPSARSGG